jgi:hypothetical protein
MLSIRLVDLLAANPVHVRKASSSPPNIYVTVPGPYLWTGTTKRPTMGRVPKSILVTIINCHFTSHHGSV